MNCRTWCQASWWRTRCIAVACAVFFALWSAGASAQVFTLTLQPNTIPSGTENTAYSQLITAVGGNAPYTFQVIAGSLPPNLSLASGGMLSGTPDTPGNYSFTIEATDNDGNTGFRPYTFSLGTQGGLTINPASLPNGVQGAAYSQTVVASNGSGGYVYSISAGSLPPGLSLNAGNGQITGTPGSSGVFNFTVFARDSNGNTGTRPYALTINATLVVNPATLANGSLGIGYNQTVTASGGSGVYTFAVSAGALPTGLSLNPNTGIVSGTPSAGGVFNFTIEATDSIGSTGSRAYSVNIGTVSLTVNPATLPNGTQGVAYGQTVSASGGTGPYTFAVLSGSLPAGLSLNASTGAITGTPTSGGLASFSIRATDTLGNTGVRAYSVNIGTNLLTVNPAVMPPAVKGKPFSQVVSAVGGIGPYTFSVSGGALPPGLSLNGTTGLISGTPSVFGASSFTIRALDINGNFGTRSYDMLTRPDPAADPEVQGLVAAQAAAARRFGSAQIDNVSRHLESLHDRFNPCSFDFGVSLPPSRDIKDGATIDSTALDARAYGAQASSPATQIARRMPGSPECADGWASSLALWVGGAVEFGSTTPDGTSASNRFTTAGLTMGLDWRANDSLVVGAAFGLGFDRTDVGQNGSRSDATSFSATLYASYKPFDPWYVDAMLGLGTLGYDNRRFVANDNLTVSGSRKGAYWFGAISTGYEFRFDALRLTPYVRADFISVQLDGYSEQGATAELLTYGVTDFSTLAGAIGLRGSYDIPVSWGTLTPMGRVEYRQAHDGALQQSLYYSDLGSNTSSLLTQAAVSRAMFNVSGGFRARAPGGLTAELEYGTSISDGMVQTQTLRGALKLPF